MSKELIVSIYDGGYYWSFCSGNRIYSRDGYEAGRYTHPKIDQLCYCLQHFLRYSDNKFLEVVRDLYPECSKVILSEDGHIDIYNIKKI